MAAVIYSTIGSVDDAKHIAHTLVKEKLVACVNLIPDIHSVYRWEGNIEEDHEVILLAKTSDVHINHVVTRIKQLHSYELPDIIVLPIIGGLEAYLAYIKEETT